MNTITCQCDLLDDDLIEAGWTCYPCYQYGKDNLNTTTREKN